MNNNNMLSNKNAAQVINDCLKGCHGLKNNFNIRN